MRKGESFCLEVEEVSQMSQQAVCLSVCLSVCLLACQPWQTLRRRGKKRKMKLKKGVLSSSSWISLYTVVGLNQCEMESSPALDWNRDE